MSYQWGRPSDAGAWPRQKYLSTLGVLVVALGAAIAVGWFHYRLHWTPLQRLYFPAYMRSYFLASLALPGGRYDLLHVTDRKGRRYAMDLELEDAATADGEATVALIPLAKEAGVRNLEWRTERLPHQALYAFLRVGFYEGQSLYALARPSLAAFAIVLLVGSLIAIPRDRQRLRERRQGQRLKGPELVPIRRFNHRLRADGVGIVQQSSTVRQWLLPPTTVRLPRALESSHLLLMGDSGTGKSSIIRQLLGQLDARGDTAIVYDPALEYTPQFYRPERGDLILNPLDARSPYWTPGDELRDPAEALTLATSLFPDKPNENPFFTDTPRRIFAHLLTYRPTAQELATWLCQPAELDRRVRGTSYATMIDPMAPAQRSGVLASLNLIADTLRFLPLQADTQARWSALEWARTRRGWLFLTSTPETRTQLVPLISLWLDMLVLRLMTPVSAMPQPVWFILDELASLHRLPQLHTAVTENRKSNNPVVLGFQGRSQLETRYGHDAEAMLSQPATKIFLRTSEPRAAKWISETIGEIEVERLRESRSHGHDRQQSYGLERQVEPLVMASEITGLSALRGFLKVENFVVRLHVPFVELPAVHPGFVSRPPRPAPVVADDTTPAAATETPDASSDLPHAPHARHGGSSQTQEPFFR